MKFFFCCPATKRQIRSCLSMFYPSEIASVSLGKFWITTAKVFLKVRRETKKRTSWQTNYVIEFQKICLQVRRSGYGKQKKRTKFGATGSVVVCFFYFFLFGKKKMSETKKKDLIFFINYKMNKTYIRVKKINLI